MHEAESVTLDAARDMLKAWHQVVVQRDSLIRLAVRSGLSKTEVAQLTGLNRDTIYRVLHADPS